MMARTHVVTAVLPVTSVAFFTHAPVPAVLLGLATLPGFALLPDIDHPNSTITRALGPIGTLPSLILKHRRETHSLVGIGAVALVTEFAVVNQGNPVANVWLSFLLVASWLAVLKLARVGGWVRLVPFALTYAIVWQPDVLARAGAPVPIYLLPWLVAAGMLIHVAGDVATHGGCPILWPISTRPLSFGWFETNSRVEVAFRFALWVSVVASTLGWLWVLVPESRV